MYDNANGLNPPKRERCQRREIESRSPALNEVSRAKGKPVTNGTFHISGVGVGESLSSEIN